MSYLIDSDIVVDYLEDRPHITQLLQSLSSSGLSISIITYGEVYEGIYYGRDPKLAEKLYLQFLRGVAVIPLTKALMKRFALARGALRRAGNLIADADLLIATTAIHHDLTLVTRNLRHFQRIPGLNLYSL